MNKISTAIIEPIGGHGGMDYYDYGLAYGLGENEVEVVYYTCDKTQIRYFKNVETVIIFKKMWDVNIACKAYRYLKGHILAFKDAKQREIGIVHLHFMTFRFIDYLILLVAKNMNFKIVGTIHDINSFYKKANFAIERKCYQLIDTVIVHNYSSLESLKTKKLSIKKVAIIPHGNYKPFITSLFPKQVDDVFTLLFFGQIRKVKGIDILLEAIKIVIDKGHKIKLIVAGKAWKDNIEYYISLIENLSIKNNVETNFRYIPDEEVSSFYSRANLVVLPYTEIYQSGVMLLTMSYGCPVLCSDLNAFREFVVDRKTGFLFQNKNKEDLANKICYIIENKHILPMIIDNASALIDTNHSWINIGKLTLDIYISL
jgi:glycosyltransferase involved in cell wall biosynthesis